MIFFENNQCHFFFGGDIGLSNGTLVTNTSEIDYQCIVFANLKEKHEIGILDPRPEEEIEPLAIMYFDNADSIDVVIKVLEEAKRRLNNG